MARRIAETAKNATDPAVNAPKAVAPISPRPIPATVTARRRRGAAGAYRTAKVPVTVSSPRSGRPSRVGTDRHRRTVSPALIAFRNRGGLGASVTSCRRNSAAGLVVLDSDQPTFPKRLCSACLLTPSTSPISAQLIP